MPENQAEQAGTPEAQAPHALHADAVGPPQGTQCLAPWQLAASGQLGGGGGGLRSSTGQYRAAKMFDSSQYPYNCFNDDADDYPAGSSDEEKRLTRPAYR